MAPDVTTRAVPRSEVTPQFLEQTVRLLSRAFGGWPRVELSVPVTEHLAWKMNGPITDFPAAIIGEVDGRLAGYRTVLPRRVLVRGVPKLFLHFVDAGVDPEFQGLGVNRAMHQLIHDEFDPQFDLSIDDSTNEHIIRGRSRHGTPRDFGNPVRPAVRPLDAARFVRNEPGRLPRRLAALRLRLASLLMRLAALRDRPHVVRCTIRTIEEFDGRFDGFCQEATAPFEFVPERTEDFLNWRYADPRAGDFTIHVAEWDGRLLGYVVTTVRAGVTAIADLLVVPDDVGVAVALVDEVVRLARRSGSTAVTCWLPERHPYRLALRTAGLFLLGDTAVLYRAVSMPDEELAFLRDRDASMHFTHGDTDFL